MSQMSDTDEKIRPKSPKKCILNIVLEPADVQKWNKLKKHFCCENNQILLVKLMDIGQEYFQRNFEDIKNKEEGSNCDTKSNKEIFNLQSKHTDSNLKENINISQFSERDIVEVIEYKTGTKVQKYKSDSNKKTGISDITDIKQKHGSNVDKELRNKNDNCKICSTDHLDYQCPLNYPSYIIHDHLTMRAWNEEFKDFFYNYDKSDDVENKDNQLEHSYANMSIPSVVKLKTTTTDHGLGVFAKVDIAKFTQFGPLVGKVIQEVDIPEDCNMKYIWDVCIANENKYICTEDIENSNWVRYIRPAPNREDRNVSVIYKEDNIYILSISSINSEEEMLFWQDPPFGNKLRAQKTNCGGCNMIFSHPIYYRRHCLVFHDVKYSLTIRKYHCKICGKAVLGKENIVKHAAELHNGQGAYQCHFCKKFFLRLNYLEMHRTYGCSLNPQRSKPLCDYCGKKFCQPQKLKVHIKRMHSDTPEVLKEFQCKDCMKIMGSKAALQRHWKEVHQKHNDGTCPCIVCGKNFQNKSNLKIHMLTHSGLKPFRCFETDCNAAFTTKQCLQFHYKKIHKYSQQDMPKIERSIDYTFRAYSGLEYTNDISIQNQNSTECDNSGPEDENSGNSSKQQSSLDTKQDTEKNIADENNPPDNKDYSRQETSNASLLVEAAIDSVCSNVDGNSRTSCPNSIVNNLYSLSQQDQLPEVPYNSAVCINDTRDMSLMSSSVTENISVTDEIGEEIRQTSDTNYTSLNDNRVNSPNRNKMVNELINCRDRVQSPERRRYDFSNTLNQIFVPSDNIKSQNLNVCYPKNSNYFNIDNSKRLKFDEEHLLNNTEEDNILEAVEGSENRSTVCNGFLRTSYENVEARSKLDIDLEMRLKHYSNDGDNLKHSAITNIYNPEFELRNQNNYNDHRKKLYENGSNEYRNDRNYEHLLLNTSDMKGIDMSTRSFHNFSNIGRYRVDLRLNYSPTTPPYSHELLRVISLDLTSSDRHSVDANLRSHPLHQITSHRLLDQSRILSSDITSNRLGENRLLADSCNRILTDHTTNRLLVNNDHLMSPEHTRFITEESRIITEQNRFLDQERTSGENRILSNGKPNGPLSPISFPNYTQNHPYHPSVTARPPTPYHYCTYY